MRIISPYSHSFEGMKTNIFHTAFHWENTNREENWFSEWEVPEIGVYRNFYDSDSQYKLKDFKIQTV